MKEEQLINLSPLVGIDSEDELIIYAKSRNPMGMCWTKFSSTRHIYNEVSGHSPSMSSVRGQSKQQEIYNSKLRALTKIPLIFREFQDRLMEAEEKWPSKVGVTFLLRDFLDNYVRIPELRDEIEEMHSRARPGSRRLRFFSAYLGGESSAPLSSSSKQRPLWKTGSEHSKLDDSGVCTSLPSLDFTENYSTDGDESYDNDDSISFASASSQNPL
jgi:hypothetical protein